MQQATGCTGRARCTAADFGSQQNLEAKPRPSLCQLIEAAPASFASQAAQTQFAGLSAARFHTQIRVGAALRIQQPSHAKENNAGKQRRQDACTTSCTVIQTGNRDRSTQTDKSPEAPCTSAPLQQHNTPQAKKEQAQERAGAGKTLQLLLLQMCGTNKNTPGQTSRQTSRQHSSNYWYKRCTKRLYKEAQQPQCTRLYAGRLLQQTEPLLSGVPHNGWRSVERGANGDVAMA